MRAVGIEKAVVLEHEQRVRLESFARSRAQSHALVVRAQIVLLAAADIQRRIAF